MALSHSNANVEAYFVSPSEKTTCDEDDVESNNQFNKNQHGHLTRLIQPSLLLHLVSFTAVIWLFVQVIQLQNELVQLHSENATISGYRTHESNPAIQTVDTRMDDIPMTSNEDFGRQRTRRQAGTQNDMDSSYYYGSVRDEGIPSLHVVGNQQQQLEPSPESWFTFHTSIDDATYARISHESLLFVHNKFIQVTMPGYYFVYSQIFYKGFGRDVIGHEIVVRPDCGDGNEFTILRAQASQILTDSGGTPGGDTGYTAGVFYLAANDRVGVRPLLQSAHALYKNDDGQGSFFGAFLLSADNNQDVDPSLRRCP